VLPPKMELCTRGDLATAAYNVTSGSVKVLRTMKHGLNQDYVSGMWVGERALLSPHIPHDETLACQDQCQFMMVPGKEFHELLSRLSIAVQFQKMLTERLWLGLCGRCGAFADHVPMDCPRFGRYKDHSTSARHALKRFLCHYELSHLEESLKAVGIVDLETFAQGDLEAIPELTTQMTDCDYEVLLAAHACCQLKHENEARCGPDNHIIFLSHYKYEAGTEATLMQKELKELIHEDAARDSLHHYVFLDTEDLQDLEDLQMHVRQSHNLVLLLTPGVLTRPWVLVEISTATRAGVHIVPVEIQLKGRPFNYPDAKFFERLGSGDLLENEARKLFESLDIKLSELAWSVQQVFKHIAVPYSPHRPDNIRQAELKDILKHCKVPDVSNFMESPCSFQRRGSFSSGTVLRRSSSVHSFLGFP